MEISPSGESGAHVVRRVEHGTELRVRNCTNPPPAHGGRDCMGPKNESRECFAGLCPVDGNYTQWTAWSTCSATCGNGTHIRYRSCINPPPSNGGRDCLGPRNETQQCLIELCIPRLYPYGTHVRDRQITRNLDRMTV
ncbi:hypothetical protein OS493_040629 [Desmophyllum pertusum]|uniref:Uncharacterized protein n=1 Tax=Desmophyllum pertusum TaxID=174260 RepID=A0A9X0D0T2_9CNID|nr:hypothetical protein OS493_040629 [Desmophyllum pertusum]